MGNLIKTGFLLVVLTCLLILIGGAVGGRQGMAIAFVLALVMNVGSYWFSDKIVLGMYGARAVTEAEAPQLYRIVRQLAAEARIPVPPIYIIQDDSPNAFATGRNPQHAAVAVTEGILRIMNEEELRGVLAHELSHVKNRDTLIMTIAATIAGAITYLAQMAQWAAIFGGGRRSDENGGGGSAIGALLMAILAPFAAMLIQMAISRSRE
ncbi:MAG TPA: M48 family metalloprotease, partial [Methylomirabilota bacterium]|nr:M48 family metalloprotease [Methylomirabilota bacterium]